jgi:hypothetical protein
MHWHHLLLFLAAVLTVAMYRGTVVSFRVRRWGWRIRVLSHYYGAPWLYIKGVGPIWSPNWHCWVIPTPLLSKVFDTHVLQVHWLCWEWLNVQCTVDEK